MKTELAEILFRRYPLIFADYLQPPEGQKDWWKIWCKDGWFDLIDALCGQLQYWSDEQGAQQAVAQEVKEKFGELRFVVRPRKAEQSGAIKMAYAMSKQICEECGAPGRHVVAGAWMTRCEQHMPEGAMPVAEYMRLLAERQAAKEPQGIAVPASEVTQGQLLTDEAGG